MDDQYLIYSCTFDLQIERVGMDLYDIKLYWSEAGDKRG